MKSNSVKPASRPFRVLKTVTPSYNALLRCGCIKRLRPSTLASVCTSPTDSLGLVYKLQVVHLALLAVFDTCRWQLTSSFAISNFSAVDNRVLHGPTSPSNTSLFFRVSNLPALDSIRNRQNIRLEHDALIPHSCCSSRFRMPWSTTSISRVLSTLPKACASVSHASLKPGSNVQVARFRRFSSFTPYQYFNNPPLAMAS